MAFVLTLEKFFWNLLMGLYDMLQAVRYIFTPPPPQKKKLTALSTGRM